VPGSEANCTGLVASAKCAHCAGQGGHSVSRVPFLGLCCAAPVLCCSSPGTPRSYWARSWWRALASQCAPSQPCTAPSTSSASTPTWARYDLKLTSPLTSP